MEMQMTETYLGDGLYASFDGFQFCLRAPRGNGDHKVFLDAATMHAFDQFRKSISAANNVARDQIDRELGKLQAGEPSITDGKR